MANYNIVVDTSNFKPFDINPTLLVLHDYRDAYYRVEDQLEKMSDEQGNIVLPDSSKYKGVLDRYNEAFNAAVDDFSKGMNYRTRLNIAGIRNQYRKDIKPIKEAVDAYNKYVDKWDAITTSDDTAIMGHNYTADDFYGGARPDLGYRSGKRIEADAIGYFTGISNALTKDPTFKTILGNQYHQLKTNPGLTSTDALLAALVQYNDVTGGEHSAEVNNIVAHMKNLFLGLNVEGFTDDAKRQVWNRISSGLIKSIQAPTYQNLQNLNFESDAARSQRKLNEEMARAENRRAEEEHLAKMRAYNNPVADGGSGNKVTVKSEDGKQQDTNGSVYTLSDGSCWYESKGKYYEVKENEDGTYQIKSGSIPYTQAQLKSKEDKFIKANSRGSDGTFTSQLYYEMGKSFTPFEFSMDDFTSSDDNEKGIRAKGFVDKGGTDFNGASSGYKAIHLSDADLPIATKSKILEEAQRRFGKDNTQLDYKDLDLYVDIDNWSDDEVRVVMRDTGLEGNYVNTATGSGRSNANAGMPSGKRK